MKFKLEIRMENAAFSDGDQAEELARILREVADEAEADAFDVPVTLTLRDVNGNTVGTARTTKYT